MQQRSTLYKIPQEIEPRRKEVSCLWKYKTSSGKGKSKGKRDPGKGVEIPKVPTEVLVETTIRPPEKLITDNEVLKEELRKIREKTFD